MTNNHTVMVKVKQTYNIDLWMIKDVMNWAMVKGLPLHWTLTLAHTYIGFPWSSVSLPGDRLYRSFLSAVRLVKFASRLFQRMHSSAVRVGSRRQTYPTVCMDLLLVDTSLFYCSKLMMDNFWKTCHWPDDTKPPKGFRQNCGHGGKKEICYTDVLRYFGPSSSVLHWLVWTTRHENLCILGKVALGHVADKRTKTQLVPEA